MKMLGGIVSFCGDTIDTRLKNELGTYSPREIIVNVSITDRNKYFINLSNSSN